MAYSEIWSSDDLPTYGHEPAALETMTVSSVSMATSSSFYLTKKVEALKMSITASNDIFWPLLVDL